MALDENVRIASRGRHFANAAHIRNLPWLNDLRATGARLWQSARQRPYLAATILAILIAVVGYFSYAATENAGSGYITAVVAKGDIEDSVTALGNLQPKVYVDVGAQATGQLKRLYVKIGDTVKQGQLLAEIDAQVAASKVQVDQGNLANLQAQLTQKQAQLSLAQIQAARQAHLKAAGATSMDAYDTAVAAAKSALADVNSVKAQIRSAQAQLNGDNTTLGYAKIYAPVSGTIVSVAILQGQTINSVQQAPTILRIADLSTMTVWTQVSEADVPKLKIGMPAYFTTLGNPNKRWTGKLQQIQPTPTVTNNVVLYTATFDVANPEQLLMTQMTAQVFFVTASAHDVVTVPVSALHQGHAHAGGRAGSWTPNQETGSAAHSSRRNGEGMPGSGKRASVLVMKPDGSVERRRITTGVSNRVSVQVLSGLQVGERVVVGQQGSTSAASPAPGAARRLGGPRL